MFSSEQDHCSGGKRKHSGELHCSRNNQDQVCRGDPLSFNGFIIFELWTEMEDNLIFSKALTDNEDIADKALENLPLGRWVIFGRCNGALCRIIFESCKILGWPTTIQLSILTDCTLRYITCLVCNRWKLITFHRFGRPEEMGGIVSFLVSDEVDFVLQLNIDGIQTQYQNQYQIWQYFPSHQASYLTGENIVLAGGMNARLW